MKVFDLGCEHGHVFEGWFASADDYVSQRARGLVECPVCGSVSIDKRLSAPRLNLGHGSDPAAGPPSVTASGAAPGADVGVPPDARALQAAWLHVARHIARNTEDVGDRFAEEARRIHRDEAPERAIRGVASAEESRLLAEEGIEVMAFPMPRDIDGPLQ